MEKALRNMGIQTACKYLHKLFPTWSAYKDFGSAEAETQNANCPLISKALQYQNLSQGWLSSVSPLY